MQPQFPTLPTFTPFVTPFEQIGPVRSQPQQSTVVTTPPPQKNNSQPVKTTQKPQQQQPQKPQQNQGHASIIHDITHNPVTNFVGTAAKDVGHAAVSTGKAVGQIVSTPYNAAKVDVAEATHNDKAAANAAGHLQADLSAGRQFVQFLPRAVMQIRNSVGEGLGGNGGNQQLSNFVPTGKAEQFVFGKEPIQSFQKIYKDTKAQQGPQQAVATTGLTAALDALAFKGGVDSAAKLSAHGVPVLKTAVDSRVPLNEAGAIGKDVNGKVPKKVTDSITGELRVNSVASNMAARNLAEKHGLDIQKDFNPVKGLQATKGGEYKGTRSGLTPQEVRQGVNDGVLHPNNLKGLPRNSKTPNLKGDTLDAKSYAKVFGTSEKEAKQQLAGMSASDKAELQSKQQMDLANLEGKGPQINKQLGSKKVAAADAANPVKVNIPHVDPNDKYAFEHARTIPQMAAEPIRAATYVAAKSASKAGLSVSDLADRVEHPEDYGQLPPKEAQAVNDWKYLTNTINATSHQLGGKEARLDNFFKHAVDTQDWAHTGESPIFDAKSGQVADASKFTGVDSISRKTDEAGNVKYPDLRSLHKAGMKLQNEDNVEKFISSYGGSAAYKIEKQALTQAFQEADGGAEAGAKTEALNLHDGKPLNLSPEAYKQARGYLKNESSLLGKIYDVPTNATKHILLSMSQYHPTNVNLLTAAPSLLFQGHPVMAARGLADTVRTAVDKSYSNDLARADLQSGLIHKSAQIGAPMYKTDFSANGETTKMGQMVFGRQIPAMQRQVNAAVLKDLEKRGIDLNSKAARDAGDVANSTMGFINAQAKNLDPRLMRTVSRFLLAPQFEMSKLNIVAKALDPRTSALARRNAIATVFGKYAAEATISLGVGTALGQKQNSVKDTLIQDAINPSIPTPLKDSKGNTIKFKLPDSGESEIVNLATGVNRGNDGRLHVSLNNPQQAGGEIVNDVRGKTAPIPGAAVKVATNENYAGKPLYQKNAPAGTKAEQAATTLTTDMLPIGTQGLVYTKPVLDHVPGNVRNVLENNKPGSNPILKSGLTTVAATPQTDQTTGKGLQTKQYFDAKDAATKGLSANDLAAFNSIHQETKDPVTGQYIVKPTVFDSEAKATLYQQHPNVLAADIKLNKQLQSNGQKVDPFFNLSADQQKAYLAYETMQPLSPDRADWMNKNNSWYKDFADSQSKYFNSLPAADPNRPTAPIKYPTPAPAVQSQMDQYNKLPQTDTAARTQFLTNHPDVVNQFADQTRSDNAIRTARGYAAVKQAPNAPADLQKYMTQYNGADKATRAGLRNSNPQMYQRMIGFYDTLDLSTIAKESGVNQLAGEPDTTNKELKAISSIAGDIYSNKGINPTNPTYQIIPAGWMGGVPNGFSPTSGGGSGSGSGSSKIAGGYPVFHAPTNGSQEFMKLASLLRSSVKLPKAGSVKYYKSAKSSSRVGKIKSNNLVKGGVKPPKFLRPQTAKVSSKRVVLSI